jgi:hypothetical protein
VVTLFFRVEDGLLQDTLTNKGIMPEKLPDTRIKVLPEQVFSALVNSWYKLFQEIPKKESICCLMAQISLETGYFGSTGGLHNFNLGNLKSREGDEKDYTFFACNELLSLEQAKSLAAKDPNTAKITKIFDNGKAYIWFYPDHIFCRFRAYRSLDDGAFDYLLLLYKRFQKAWPAIIAGNPTLFSKKLSEQTYYTAPEPIYTKTLLFWYSSFLKFSLDPAKIPILTQEDIDNSKTLVQQTLQEFEDEIPIVGQGNEPDF